MIGSSIACLFSMFHVILVISVGQSDDSLSIGPCTINETRGRSSDGAKWRGTILALDSDAVRMFHPSNPRSTRRSTVLGTEDSAQINEARPVAY
jgi:hypothetical protein